MGRIINSVLFGVYHRQSQTRRWGNDLMRIRIGLFKLGMTIKVCAYQWLVQGRENDRVGWWEGFEV